MAVADNSYIVTGADMMSIANKIREKAGVSDGLVFPNGWLETIEAIESGGSIEFKTGTVTFTEKVKSYIFVNDVPDLFILYIEQPMKNTTTSQQPDDVVSSTVSTNAYVWTMIQYKRSGWKYYTTTYPLAVYFTGYNVGTNKLYTSLAMGANLEDMGAFRSGNFNSSLGAVTYRWFAFYGIEAFI